MPQSPLFFELLLKLAHLKLQSRAGGQWSTVHRSWVEGFTAQGSLALEFWEVGWLACGFAPIVIISRFFCFYFDGLLLVVDGIGLGIEDDSLVSTWGFEKLGD